VGRKNDAAFRIVVIEHTAGPNSGKNVEHVGSYNPKTKALTLKKDRVEYWMSVGAKASDSVHNLLVKEGIIEGSKKNVLPKKSPIVKEVEEKEEEAAPAPEAPVEGEAPAAEEAAPVEEEAAAPAEEEAPKEEEAPVAEEAQAPEEEKKEEEA